MGTCIWGFFPFYFVGLFEEVNKFKALGFLFFGGFFYFFKFEENPKNEKMVFALLISQMAIFPFFFKVVTLLSLSTLSLLKKIQW